MITETEFLDIPKRIIFKRELKKQGRSIDWFAGQLEFSYDHVRKIFDGRRSLTKNHIQKMNEILELNVPTE